MNGRPPAWRAIRAYQFAFYTFYQLFFWFRPSERESAWKAGLVIMIVQLWIALIVLFSVGLLEHTGFWPPAWASGLFLLADAALVHYAFDRHERWTRYVHQFQHYSRRQLVVGRLIVAGMFLLIATTFFVLLWRVSATLPRPNA